MKKIHKCALKVTFKCPCRAHEQKLMKTMKKIGVYEISLDMKHGKLEVIGRLDTDQLIRKLKETKMLVDVELWEDQNGLKNAQADQLNNEFKNMTVGVGESSKGTRKGKKTVKFVLPDEEEEFEASRRGKGKRIVESNSSDEEELDACDGDEGDGFDDCDVHSDEGDGASSIRMNSNGGNKKQRGKGKIGGKKDTRGGELTCNDKATEESDRPNHIAGPMGSHPMAPPLSGRMVPWCPCYQQQQRHMTAMEYEQREAHRGYYGYSPSPVMIYKHRAANMNDMFPPPYGPYMHAWPHHPLKNKG